MINYIYGLYDPRNGNLRYIGKSIRPNERLSNHLNDKSKTWRTNWFSELKREGLKPILYIFDALPESEDWAVKEIEYIAYAKSRGIRLTNCTDGGDGVTNLSGPGKERMLKTWKGRKHKPETLIKLSKASKGRLHSKEWKNNMSKTMKGRKITWKNKVGKANEKLNDDQIVQIRKLLNDKVSQYTIADMFNVHQGTISNIKNGKCYANIL